MIACHDSKTILLQLCGRVDLESSARLRQQFAEIESNRHSLWVVDLSQVDFIDCAGLVALMSGLNLAHERRCQLVLRNPRPSVRLVFEITRLDEVFELVEGGLDVVAIADKPAIASRSAAHPVAA